MQQKTTITLMVLLIASILLVSGCGISVDSKQSELTRSQDTYDSCMAQCKTNIITMFCAKKCDQEKAARDSAIYDKYQ